MKELEAVAKLVVSERISRGWAQAELSRAASVGMSTLQRIEQGRSPLATPRIMQKLAMAFGKHYDARRIAFSETPPAEGPARKKNGVRLVLSAELSRRIIERARSEGMTAEAWLVSVLPPEFRITTTGQPGQPPSPDEKPGSQPEQSSSNGRSQKRRG